MALTKLEGSFSGSSSTPAVDFRNMLNTQFSALGGNWSVVDHNFVNGTVARTVVKNTAGFCFMVTSQTTTNATVNFYFGRDYYTEPQRTFTITAASSSGVNPAVTYTYTTSVNHNIQVGERVTISNISVDTNYQRTNVIVTGTPAANQFTVDATSSRTARTGLAGVASLNPTGAITNAVGDGTNVVYTYTQTYGYDFKIGDSVWISGISPAGYNTTGTIIAATPTTITVANTETAAYTSGGIIGLLSNNILPPKTIGKRGLSSLVNNPTLVDENGFNTNSINPSAIATSNIDDTRLMYTALASQTNWIIMYDNTYAIVGVKDGTTTNGKWFYVGEAESLVGNSALTEFSPFVFSGSIMVGDNNYATGTQVLQSLGNEGKNINQKWLLITEAETNFIGSPGTILTRDLYATDPAKTTACNFVIVRSSSALKTAIEPNADGWLRFRLKDVVFTYADGSSWGDTTEIDGSDYQYIGGTGSTFTSSSFFAGWVRIN
jgi:hypothetical protein